ncbi:MAG: hypothetical protein HRU15_11855, partial [Planctomycetes bacterium]|nr:hypothetical protein [Planctomycetota bacterium]
MSELQAQSLSTWQGAHGFISHWFICGFFPAGVEHAGEPSLMDNKISSEWETDHLKA